MKKLIFLLICAAMLAVSPSAHSQTFFVTNGESLLNISNGTVVWTTNIAPPVASVILTTNGVVVPQAFLVELSAQTGIPMPLLNVIPMKALVWLAMIAAFVSFLSYFSGVLRKVIPDSWQVNNFGLALAHINNEVNPSIPKLAAAAVEQSTPAAPQVPPPAFPSKIAQTLP